MGTPEFAVPTLRALVDAGHEVVLVVAQPDKPAGRGQQLTAPPVAQVAVELGLPLAQPRAVRSGSFPARVVGLQADVAVVIAYGRLLTPEVLHAPRFGCVNVHASLLPRWRGAAPIQAAILAGDAVTGVCTQRMEEGLDTGPVFREVTTPVGAHETAGALHDRLSLLSAQVAVDTLAVLGSVEPVPQDDTRATHAPKIAKDDGVIRWTDDAVQADRRVRAMTPWPGGQVAFDGGVLKLKEVRVASAEAAGAAPGTILSTSPLVVACGQGALELVTVQAPGRKPVSGTDFANGARLSPGGLL
ncbi:MAG: methionyl-tRNA formyltransferase [Alphaproteobacteria bacterium]|nr:methionyl-tRNA formyltransferase [Alphaproteobacteria bacterium]